MNYYWDNWKKELVAEEDVDKTMPPERYMKVIPHEDEGDETFVMVFRLAKERGKAIAFAYREETERRDTFTKELLAYLERCGLTLYDIVYPAREWYVPKSRLEFLKKNFEVE